MPFIIKNIPLCFIFKKKRKCTINVKKKLLKKKKLVCLWVFPDGPVVKEPACNARDMGLIPGLRRSPEVGNGNPLQYSFWEIPGTEGPGGLQSTGSQRGGHNLVTEHIHRHANQCVSTLFRKNHGNLRAKLYFDSTPACGVRDTLSSVPVPGP